MKRLLTSLLLWTAAVSLAQAAPIAKITTLTGKTYRQCQIVRVHPDGVSFRHTDGAAKVLFTDLSKEWRARLGYDADKAAAYHQELADKREADKAARAKAEEARFKLLAEAAERARIQSLGQEAQVRANVQQQQQNFGPSVIPVLPALGAVHQPGSDYGRYERPYIPYWNGGYGYPAGYGYGYGYGTGYFTPGWGVCPPRRTFRVTIRR
jgi:hypothetical protein